MKREMFETLMKGEDSIVFSDVNGTYVEVSQKKADNWGKTRKEMRGLTDFDLMSEEEAKQAREDSLKVMETGEPLINCRRPAIRNGEAVWYSLSEYPWFNELNGEIRGTVSVSRNMTEQVEQEQKTSAMSQQILDMVKIVSHDLSSPLITISANAKLILNRKFGEINPEVFNEVTNIYKRILKLRGVVLDYLHKFTNLSEGQEVEKELVDLRKDVIDEVLEELEEYIEDNKSIIDSALGLIPSGAIILETNKVFLKIIYRNLISNALKHGGIGCVISFGYEDWGERFVLNVYDNGCGVPDDEIPFLFEPFIQGKNAPKGSGFGIGLATIRNMIRSLDGDLWYEKTFRGHSNFKFTILK